MCDSPHFSPTPLLICALLCACVGGPPVPPVDDRYDLCRDVEAEAELQRANELLARGADQEALAPLRQVVSACPEYVPGHELYQDTALRLGGSAEREMRAFYGDPEQGSSPVPPFAAARIEVVLATQMRLLDAAIERDRSFYYAYVMKARILRRLHRTSQALEMLQLAIAAKADDPEANLSLAEVLAELGRSTEAVAYYANYAELRPGDRRAKKAYVELLVYQLERPQQAAPLVQDLLRRDPDDVEVLMDQAAVAWLLGQVRRSIEVYHRVLELDPSLARAVLNLGNLYYDVLAGDTEEGRRQYWPKARNAYRYYLQMNQAEGLYDLFDQNFAVPFRLKEIAALLGPPDERQPSIADF